MCDHLSACQFQCSTIKIGFERCDLCKRSVIDDQVQLFTQKGRDVLICEWCYKYGGLFNETCN